MPRPQISNGEAGSSVRDKLNDLLSRAIIVMEPVDLSDDLFPSGGGSGDSGAVCKNDEFPVEVGGAPGGAGIDAGQRLRALEDAPGQTLASWTWY